MSETILGQPRLSTRKPRRAAEARRLPGEPARMPAARRHRVAASEVPLQDDGTRGRGLPLLGSGPVRLLLQAGGVALALLVLWQGVILVFQPPYFMLPSPAAVFAALAERPAFWFDHTLTTLSETLIGFAAGAVAGIGLALLMSFLPLTRKLVLPVMVVSQAFPVFVIAPLLVLWLGFGLASKIVMATIAIFFPVASAFHDGLTRTEPQLLDLGRLYGARRAREILYLRIPSALPALISGLRLAAVYAPIGALIGEWVGASSGLGYAMLHANGRAQTDEVFAALFLIAVMAVLLRAAVDLVTARLAPWAPETPIR